MYLTLSTHWRHLLVEPCCNVSPELCNCDELLTGCLEIPQVKPTKSGLITFAYLFVVFNVFSVIQNILVAGLKRELDRQ